jgi:two-component system sensor histidine kinase TctE
MIFSLSSHSARSYLLAWIIAPIVVFIAVDTFTLYRNALDSVNTAYDRTLVASAQSIADLLRIEDGRLKVTLPHAALEIYEAGISSQMVYRVSGLNGEFLSGDRELAQYTGPPQSRASYPAVVRIYEDLYRGQEVRVAAIFQPVVSNEPTGRALVQVAETVEHRKNMARKILHETLLHQAILVAVLSLVTWVVVSRAQRPLETLRTQLDQRHAEDLSPIAIPFASKEVQPVVRALNQLMARLQPLLDHQQRFVADASHQLRTPLAVLKTQLQSGLQGDAPPLVILQEMAGTVERASKLANQLLSLAKVEQLRGRGQQEPCDLAMLGREVAVNLSPLIGEKNLDYELDAEKIAVMSQPWMIAELISNLLHNAIRHAPQDSKIGVRIAAEGEGVLLCVWDSGPGIAAEMDSRVFQPFTASHSSQSGGLGLTICSEIAASIGATIALENRIVDGRVAGLNALVRIPAPVRVALRA